MCWTGLACRRIHIISPKLTCCHPLKGQNSSPPLVRPPSVSSVTWLGLALNSLQATVWVGWSGQAKLCRSETCGECDTAAAAAGHDTWWAHCLINWDNSTSQCSFYLELLISILSFRVDPIWGSKLKTGLFSHVIAPPGQLSRQWGGLDYSHKTFPKSFAKLKTLIAKPFHGQNYWKIIASQTFFFTSTKFR